MSETFPDSSLLTGQIGCFMALTGEQAGCRVTIVCQLGPPEIFEYFVVLRNT
jgi:hypothetical protein